MFRQSECKKAAEKILHTLVLNIQSMT